MRGFLEQQILKIEEELKQLYIDRARSGIETEGSYDIMIGRKKRELNKLNNDLDGIGDEKNELLIPDSENSEVEIKTLIANGRIEEAIKELIKSSSDNRLILLSARYNQIKRQDDSGTITQNNFSIEFNKITNSLLSILNDL